MPVHEYIELSAADREGKTPFVWSTDDDKKLIKLEVSQTLIHLVQERRKYWRTLQYLSGLDVAKLDADHHAELEALQRQYKESVEARESSIDSIARAMSELAASSNAPPSNGFAAALMPGRRVRRPRRRRQARRRPTGRRWSRSPTKTSRSAPTARPAIRI